ncbi:MAG: HDOD domain-containing protein [Chitinispirillaceae bacterium]|jgi:HD-like signal output (HDOD) protein|nr:HDOD domain-containing protein [Chitinispirillaceae bacterium]
MRRQQELLREKFGHLVQLPTLPEISSRLMGLIRNPRASVNDVADIIGQDVSLSAKVLRLANSAYYGMPGKITTINNAVVLLGFRVITTIVLSVTVFDLFPEGKGSSRLFDHKAFWRHSFGCGLIAKHLALCLKKKFLFDPEESFCAGLLHDIGKVVLEQYLHAEFHRALNAAKSDGLPLFTAEKKVLGFTHADAGQWLTAGWGLPSGIGEPLARHHDSSSGPHQADSAALCQAADWLCYQTGMAIDPACVPPMLDQGIRTAFALSDSLIEEIRVTVPDEVEQSFLFAKS